VREGQQDGTTGDHAQGDDQPVACGEQEAGMCNVVHQYLLSAHDAAGPAPSERLCRNGRIGFARGSLTVRTYRSRSVNGPAA